MENVVYGRNGRPNLPDSDSLSGRLDEGTTRISEATPRIVEPEPVVEPVIRDDQTTEQSPVVEPAPTVVESATVEPVATTEQSSVVQPDPTINESLTTQPEPVDDLASAFTDYADEIPRIDPPRDTWELQAKKIVRGSTLSRKAVEDRLIEWGRERSLYDDEITALADDSGEEKGTGTFFMMHTQKPLIFEDFCQKGACPLFFSLKAEVQINIPEMIEAKSRAHPLYEKQRSIVANDQEIRKLEQLQQEIYGTAWESAFKRFQLFVSSTNLANSSTETMLPNAEALAGFQYLLGSGRNATASPIRESSATGTSSTSINVQPDGRFLKSNLEISSSVMGQPSSSMVSPISRDATDNLPRFTIFNG